MEGGFEGSAKKKVKMGEGSGVVGGDGGSGAVGCGGGSGAVAHDGGSGSRGAVWSGGAGGSRGGWSDAAAAAASAEVFVPKKKKKKKNRKTRTQRGLPSMKLGIRPPAFEEFIDDDGLEEEPDDEVDDDKESRDKKSRHVLSQLRLGRWDYQPEIGKYICPFCDNVKATDYDGMVAHAIGIGLDGHGRRAHVRAKHAAYGLFLQRIKVD